MNGALVNIISASAEGIAAVAAKTFLVSNYLSISVSRKSLIL